MRYFRIDLNTVLKISELYYEEIIPPRRHCSRYAPEYILYAVMDGSLHLEDNGKPVTLHSGDIYIFNKGEFHKPIGENACKYIYIHFTTDCLTVCDMSEEQFLVAAEKKRENLLKSDHFALSCYDYMYVHLAQHFHIDDIVAFNNIIKELKKHFIAPNSRRAGECLNVSFAVAKLFLELENAQTSHQNSPADKTASKTHATVKNIASYIEETYSENISRKEIEKKFYLNFDYANRIFKKYTGHSISKYKNAVRIRTAKKLMMSSSKTLGEIAEEIGFRDQYYFSRVFKQLEGVSPSEYMRRFMFTSGEIADTRKK